MSRIIKTIWWYISLDDFIKHGMASVVENVPH